MKIRIKDDAVERLAQEIEEIDDRLQRARKIWPEVKEDPFNLKYQRRALESAFEIVTGVSYIDYWLDQHKYG